MRHEFEFTFDTDFIRGALRRDLLWKGYALASVLVLMPIGFRLAYGRWDWWIVGFFVAAAVFIVWRFHSVLHQAAERVCEMWRSQSPNGAIKYELDEQGFDVILEKGRSRFEWAGLRRLWRYDDVWMLEIVKMQSAFFPPDQVPAVCREFIVERCQAAGVRT